MTRYVTRKEAAEILGYRVGTLATYMSRDPETWPGPVGKRRSPSGQMVHVYDLDELLAAAKPAHASKNTDRLGEAVSMSDPDGLLTCLYCGYRARTLTPHLKHEHGVTAAEYRDEHKLPATASMWADGTRERRQAHQRELLADDPTAFDHLAPYHSPEHTSMLGRRATESIRQTSGYEMVRAAHAEHRAKGVAAMHQAKRAEMDAKAQAAGFVSMEAAIRETRGMTVRAAAEAIGVGVNTVGRWRRRV